MRKSKPSSARLPIAIRMTTVMIKMEVMMMLVKMASMIKMVKVHDKENADNDLYGILSDKGFSDAQHTSV